MGQVQSLLKDHKYISFVQFYMLSNIYEKQDIFWVTERIKNLSLLVDVHNRYVSRCDAFINPNNESVVRILSTVVTLRPISFPYFLCCILIFIWPCKSPFEYFQIIWKFISIHTLMATWVDALSLFLFQGAFDTSC